MQLARCKVLREVWARIPEDGVCNDLDVRLGEGLCVFSVSRPKPVFVTSNANSRAEEQSWMPQWPCN
jgi:hypothetical protein